MCGIAGSILEDPAVPFDDRRMTAALEAMRDRGPDATTTHHEPGVFLGHTRLAILDAAGGRQPFSSPDGRYIVVFNGEIYNHHALRRTLDVRRYRLSTRCDTEVLPALYDRDGETMVDALRGMFAFAVVDRERRSVFLARDRFGKKPLFVAPVDGDLHFASTLDALRCLLPNEPKIDPEALAAYLTLQYIPAPQTPYRGVFKLPPGHWARWEDGEFTIRRYWEPPAPDLAATVPADGGTSLRAELRSSVASAVTARLESDVPLGVFLSGGLDSSIIVAEMTAAGRRPATYSAGFGRAAFDESRYARLVASHFDTDHHELVPDEDADRLFERFTTAYDEPFADPSALATLAVAEAAAGDVTVVLTGDGGDELFGGYERYAFFRRAAAIRSRWGPLASVGAALAKVSGSAFRMPRLAAAGRWVGNPWPSYRDALFHFPPAALVHLIRADLRASVDVGAPAANLDRLWEQAPTVHGLQWIDQQTYLPGDLLTKMDRATMAFGLEARSPFLDQELARFSAALPEALLYDPRAGKRILREAYTDVLPSEILTRPKMGFGIPLAAWLRNELRGRLEDLILDPRCVVWDWLEPQPAMSLVRRFLAGDDRPRWKVWNLLALAGWATVPGRVRR